MKNNKAFEYPKQFYIKKKKLDGYEFPDTFSAF